MAQDDPLTPQSAAGTAADADAAADAESGGTPATQPSPAASTSSTIPRTASEQSAEADSPARRMSAWKVAVPLVAVVAGLMFGVSSRAANGTDLRSGSTDLADVVRRADHRVKTKQADVAALRLEVEAQQKAAAKDAGAAQVLDLTKAADKAQDPAGLAPLTGDAVTVTLDDSKKKVEDLPEGGSADWLVVHQQDVQAVVNALWAGGARGMKLMDQRVVSTSAVRCVGNTLILQGRVYSPPFTITAVGDRVRMQSALDTDPAVKIYKEYVDLVGLGYDVKTTSNTTLPAFTGTLANKFATPVR